MKSYPSIDHKWNTEVDIWAFDKLDGSNIRAEWSPKRGFYKFGSRKRMIDESCPHLGKAVTIIKEKYAPVLPRIFAKLRWHYNVVCFFEFLGPNSAFGQHHKDDDHDVVLIDVAAYKQGFTHPKEFVKYFGETGIPAVLYRGRVDKEFVDQVKQNTLPGMTNEGVVCKAPNPRKKKTGKPVMFKIKSNRWLDQLREHCKGNDVLFKRLK